MDPGDAKYDGEMDAANSAALEKMEKWFRSRYEDPAQNTPYESAEGGYIYIWGGPYDAYEVLSEEFEGEVESSLIEYLAEELTAESGEWARIPTAEDFDQEPPSAHLDSAMSALQNVREAIVAAEGKPNATFQYALLYAHIITVLEAFLGDVFIKAVLDPKFLRRFVETDPSYQKESLTISDIFKKSESLDADVRKKVSSIVYHNLPVVQRMYRDTLGIEFPKGMKDLIPAVLKRHDIIHRNCRDKDSLTTFVITKGEVETLDTLVTDFILALEAAVTAALK